MKNKTNCIAIMELIKRVYSRVFQHVCMYAHNLYLYINTPAKIQHTHTRVLPFGQRTTRRSRKRRRCCSGPAQDNVVQRE